MRTSRNLVAYGLAASTIAASLFGVYFFGKSRSASDPAPVPAVAESRTPVLLGKIARVEPLHLFIDGSAFGRERAIDVIVDGHTTFMQLAPWEPGEYEAAQKKYQLFIDGLKPKNGDPIPPPPMEMKFTYLPYEKLVPGLAVGVLMDAPIEPGQPLTALVVRPLTEKEAATGRVAIDFPRL